MEKLIVLNYSTNSIDIYSNPPEDESTEEILSRLGHSINDCTVMYTEKLNINIH